MAEKVLNKHELYIYKMGILTRPIEISFVTGLEIDYDKTMFQKCVSQCVLHHWLKLVLVVFFQLI